MQVAARTKTKSCSEAGAVEPLTVVYLGLGSNVGDRFATMIEGLRLLGDVLENLRASSMYVSAARYVIEQRSFGNCVIRGSTTLGPEALLDAIHGIEGRLGRDRAQELRMGPRSLDIDILLYGLRVIHTKHLSIPHPRMEERQFVLLPLLELAPMLRSPASGTPYAAVSEELGPQGVYLASLGRYTRLFDSGVSGAELNGEP